MNLSYYNSWCLELITPKFTIRNFSDELHYYLRIYLKQKKSFWGILIFLFLNATQRVCYTIGSFIIKKKYRFKGN